MVQTILALMFVLISPALVLGDQTGGGSPPDLNQVCLNDLATGFNRLKPPSPEGISRYFSLLSQQTENGNKWLEAYLSDLSFQIEHSANTCEKIHRSNMAKASIKARKTLLKYADFYTNSFYVKDLERLFEIENLPEKVTCLTEQLIKYRSVRGSMEEECSITKEESSIIFSTKFMADQLESYIKHCSYPMPTSLRQEVIKIQEQRVHEEKEYKEIYRAEQKYFSRRFPNLKAMFDDRYEKYTSISQVDSKCEDPNKDLFNQIKLSTRKIQGAARGTFKVASGSGFLTQGDADSEKLLVTAFHSVNPTKIQRDSTRTAVVFDLINEKDRLNVEIKPRSHSALNDIVTIKLEASQAPLLPIVDSGKNPDLNQVFFVAGFPDMNANEYSVYQCFFVGYENKMPFHLNADPVKKYKMFCPTRVNLEGISGGPVFDENGVVWGVDSAQDFVEGSILVSPISRNSNGMLVFGIR